MEDNTQMIYLQVCEYEIHKSTYMRMLKNEECLDRAMRKEEGNPKAVSMHVHTTRTGSARDACVRGEVCMK